MPVTSNLYADYILGQHPIAFWTLDETLSGTTINLGSSSGLGFYSASTVNAYEANTYNYTGQTGYYISSKTSNTSFPMIYGSGNATLAGNKGAILLPAFGFLNSLGKYNTYTFETFLKIGNTYTSDTKKLISCFINYDAPTADDNNGLYFNDTSFILRIGNNIGTHYIKDFNKPMLIQLIYTTKTLSLVVNGESLIELSLSSSDIDNLTTASKNYIMLSNAYYDTVALYNYTIDKNQIKLNYSKALNAPYPYPLISRYDGKGFEIDYKFAKYSNSIKLPNGNSGINWHKAMKNNLDTRDLSISNNKYSLPDFNFSDSTITKETIESSASPTFQFKKISSSWVSAEANIRFESLDILKDDKVKAFYLDGTFTSLPATEQTIFKIINKRNKNYFKISVDSTNIYYKFKWGTGSETTLRTETLPAVNSGNYYFYAGIDIDTFIQNFSTTTEFFNNAKDLTVYVAGEDTLTTNTTLTATINSIKFLNLINLKQKPALVSQYGTFNYPSSGIITSTISTQNTILGSYDLNLYNNTTLGKYYFTIGTSGYWKNHIPLQNLATYSKDSSGVKTYSLDFIQFNIDYSAPITKVQVSGDWIFDTIVSSPYLKTYITFENGTSTYKEDSYFTTQIGPNINRVVNPTINWQTTKYEIVDDFIIYMPSDIDISKYNITISVEISLPDTIYNEIELKQLQFASKTLSKDVSVSNPIPVADGKGELEPYTYTLVSGNKQYDYKTYKNPYIINKQIQQYLQLSRQSGIRLVGDYTAGQYRGIKYNINKTTKSIYNISNIQMFLYYEGLSTRTGSTITQNYFSSTPVEIFQIQTATRNIKFYITSTTPGVDTQTGKIYSQTDSGVIDDNLVYYINGRQTTSPIINANEWFTLGLGFIDKLDFDDYAGYIAFTGPISFDNVSFYQLINKKNIQNTTFRTWTNVQTPFTGSSTYTWNSWLPNIWNDLIYTGGSISSAAIDMNSLYNMFVGTNRLLNDYPETRDLVVLDDSHLYYDATVNQTNTYSPA